MSIPTDVEKVTLVHIAAKKDGPDWVLHVFPSRPGDTIAFFSKNPAKESPERPHKVVWVGHGLTNAKMKIVISEKPGLSPPDAGALAGGYTLTQAAQSVEGPTLHAGNWRYNIEFWADYTTGGPADCTVDPDVIVHNDP